MEKRKLYQVTFANGDIQLYDDFETASIAASHAGNYDEDLAVLEVEKDVIYAEDGCGYVVCGVVLKTVDQKVLDYVRRNALAKLTVAERKALGL